eukprot:TRINITY_DN3665_c0_g1_i1.p1 TRINITY_DN3665_c0_g1~~TRINITY_DN3665_c0_g1_i1.p1  ORF type:complete len:401 (-),score=75.44 TRINITY_DN3665_c0_g1_i1:43-1245(-)
MKNQDTLSPLFRSDSEAEPKKKNKLLLFGLIFLGVSLSLLVIALIVLFTVDLEDAPQDPFQRALYLQERHPFADCHNDLPWFYKTTFGGKVELYDISKKQSLSHTDLVRLKEGRSGIVFWSVYVACGNNSVSQTLEQIDIVYKMVSAWPDKLQLVTSSDEIFKAFKNKKIVSLIGMEGGHSIGSSIGALRMFYKLGARYMTLTHNCNTAWAEAAINNGDFPEVVGLTDLGREIVLEMNKLGMLVDISHVSERTMRDVLNVTKAPVIFSHSNSKAMWSHPRNAPDDVLMSLKKNGGVIHVTFVPEFLASGTTNVTTVVDHVDHIKSLIGVEHIGVGPDYDGISNLPVGLEDVSKYPIFTAELIRRGYTDSEIIKIIGGNTIRVLTKVEQVAKELSKTMKQI